VEKTDLTIFFDLINSIRANNITRINELLDKDPELLNVKWGEARLWGATPLVYACLHGNLDIIKLLIEFGANLNPNENYDTVHTPLSIAAMENRLDIVKILLDSGADANLYQGPWQTTLEVYIERRCNSKSHECQQLLKDLRGT
jgi:ankyrin repeat protein